MQHHQALEWTNNLLSGSLHLLNISMSSSTWTKGPWFVTPKKKKKVRRLFSIEWYILWFCQNRTSLTTFWSFQNSLKQTWKQTGGGRSFMRTTAAGGTGNTPPGTGCKPGAVGRKTVWSQCKTARLELLLQHYYLFDANNCYPVTFASTNYKLFSQWSEVYKQCI